MSRSPSLYYHLELIGSVRSGIWADNGDAISREYAGTSALKGDFTRTGKRDWRGAMNDASNSVARSVPRSPVTLLGEFSDP